MFPKRSPSPVASRRRGGPHSEGRFCAFPGCGQPPRGRQLLSLSAAYNAVSAMWIRLFPAACRRRGAPCPAPEIGVFRTFSGTGKAPARTGKNRPYQRCHADIRKSPRADGKETAQGLTRQVWGGKRFCIGRGIPPSPAPGESGPRSKNPAAACYGWEAMPQPAAGRVKAPSRPAL